MKKTKQVLAILAVIVLVGLYLSTLVCSLLQTDNAANLFKASIYATIVLPALIWIYTATYKFIKDHNQDDESADK